MTPTPPGDGGPAFPTHTTKTIEFQSLLKGGNTHQTVPHTLPGMSLRAYLAGRAMQGILANQQPSSDWAHPVAIENNVLTALLYADALLAELEKEQKPSSPTPPPPDKP